MIVPICGLHMVEMQCADTGGLINFPIAQYIYSCDKWECPVDSCMNETLIRAGIPVAEASIHAENYQHLRNQVSYAMWNV
jgi:hypothetical protein